MKTKKPKIKDKFKWKTIPPKENEPTKEVNGHTYYFKVVNSQEYYWCQYHTAWVLHKPEGDGKQGCQLCKQQESGETPKKKCDNKSFMNALTTIFEEIQEEEEDEQDDL